MRRKRYNDENQLRFSFFYNNNIQVLIHFKLFVTLKQIKAKVHALIFATKLIITHFYHK